MGRVKKHNVKGVGKSAKKSPAGKIRRRSRPQGKKAGGGGGVGGQGGKIADARLKIIAKSRSNIVDARDRLAAMAKTTDARQKLKTIRNRKEGKADVKTAGSLTITTKLDGKLTITTARKAQGQPKKVPNRKNGAPTRVGNDQAARGGNGPRGGSGASRMAASLGIRAGGGVAKRRARPGARGEGLALSPKPHFRYPVEDRPHPLSRLPEHDRFAQRSSPDRPRYNEHDDRRAATSRYDHVRGLYGKHVVEPEMIHRGGRPSAAVAMEEPASSGSFVSPLQGTKVVVYNLQPSVTRDDVVELFGDIGPLKRTKMPEPGTAEIVFVNKSDALRAIDIYHNRQLDGKPMRVKIMQESGSDNRHYPAFSRDSGSHGPPPDLSAIHKALFSDKGSRPSLPSTSTSRSHFTITVDNRRSGGGGRGYRH